MISRFPLKYYNLCVEVVSLIETKFQEIQTGFQITKIKEEKRKTKTNKSPAFWEF